MADRRFELVCEIEPPTRPDLTRVLLRTQSVANFEGPVNQLFTIEGVVPVEVLGAPVTRYGVEVSRG